MSAYNKNYFNIVKELLNGTLTKKKKKKKKKNIEIKVAKTNGKHMCIMNNKFRFLDATNVILNALPFLIKDKIWEVGKKI